MPKNKKEKWQKFASEYVVSLFPIFMLVDSIDQNIKKMVGESAYILAKIENNNIEWYNLPKNWGKVHFLLADKIKKSPSFLTNIFIQIEKRGKKLVTYSKFISKNFENKNNKKINSLYQSYVKENTDLYTYGLILPLLDFQNKTFLSDELNNILKKRKGEKYFQVLTTPLRETFNKKQEVDLFKILSEIKKNNKLFNKFEKLNSNEIIEEIKLNYRRIYYLIDQHTKRYCWVNYVYEGPAVGHSYFVDLIKDIIIRKIDLKKALINNKRDKKILIKKQKDIIKKLKVNSYEKQIIDLARDAVFFKAYRRELQSCSYYYMESLLKEIAVRTNLSLKQIRMMRPEEMAQALLKNRINVNIINERIKLVIYHRFGGQNCITGTKAGKFVKEMIKKEKIIKKYKTLFGSVAFGGRVKGRVKIINAPSEMFKMKCNDILVSASTNPNLMPAIRQAAAIVTDEGGLTCHAAIVAREFKIPCIVGTKIATEVLKDEELIEVDAMNGVIKKIK